MRVVAASDHAGYELRTLLIRLVERLGHTVSDLGTRGSAPVDYPDSSRRSAERYEQTDRLILICGSSVEATRRSKQDFRHPGSGGLLAVR